MDLGRGFVYAPTMPRALTATLAALALLATASPAIAGDGFKNRTEFQAYVAGYLHIGSVSCDKLNARVADCLGSDHHRYVVACATPGGERCIIRRYA